MLFPNWEMDFDLDYQTCIKKIMQNQLGFLTDPATQAALDAQMQEMRDQVERERIEM